MFKRLVFFLFIGLAGCSSDGDSTQAQALWPPEGCPDGAGQLVYEVESKEVCPEWFGFYPDEELTTEFSAPPTIVARGIGITPYVEGIGSSSGDGTLTGATYETRSVDGCVFTEIRFEPSTPYAREWNYFGYVSGLGSEVGCSGWNQGKNYFQFKVMESAENPAYSWCDDDRQACETDEDCPHSFECDRVTNLCMTLRTISSCMFHFDPDAYCENKEGAGSKCLNCGQALCTEACAASEWAESATEYDWNRGCDYNDGRPDGDG